MAEDAYSNRCSLSVQQENLALTMQLDDQRETVNMMPQIPDGKLIDMVFRPDFPVTYREGDMVNIEIPGTFQYLYMDHDGNMQSVGQNSVGTLEYPAAEGCQLIVSVQGAEMMDHSAVVNLSLQTGVNQELSMICGVTLGEKRQLDQALPTLVLRRMNSEYLWQLAKETGSTMDAIRKANQLNHEPDRGQMLLIPLN